MPPLRRLLPGEPSYPARLLKLVPPPQLWVQGDLAPAPTVAIIGTRESHADAEAFARDLARSVVAAGGVVVSGGAVGIDAAAHQGALQGNGRTWCVPPTGHRQIFPREHASLFESIPERGGAMIWAFEPDAPPILARFFTRNRVLVALCDAVVVVEAGIPSGALNAARWARTLGRALWAVPGPPWIDKYAGCLSLITAGARMLTSIELFLREQLGVRGTLPLLPPPPAPEEVTARILSPDENAAVRATDSMPRHLEEIAYRAGLPLPTLATLLLTLALENVVVEGPHGFFRRASTP